MINHYTLVIIRKVGDPRIVEIHDKVEMIKFVIQRTDHEDLVINVNGGTYRDE